MTTTELDVSSLSIIHFPHPTLRYEAKPIRRVDSQLRDIISRMFELMYEHRGVGLAATQVDMPFRLFVMNPSGEKGDGYEQVLINPVISRPRGSEEAEEGCLSLPDLRGNVVRAKTIRLNAYDLSGQEINQDVSGFEARVIQHETDHLDGRLFIDRMKESALADLAGALDVLQTDFESRRRTDAIPPEDTITERRKRWEERYC